MQTKVLYLSDFTKNSKLFSYIDISLFDIRKKFCKNVEK